jgi:hypothetical protein
VSFVGADAAKDVARVCVAGQAHVDHPEVIARCEGVVQLASGQSLVFDCDMDGPNRQRVEAVTRTGSVVIDEFVLPEIDSSAFDGVRPGGSVKGKGGGKGRGVCVERTASIVNGKPELIWPEREIVEVCEDELQPVAMVRTFIGLVLNGNEDGLLRRKRWAEESVATQALVSLIADAVREGM